MRDPGSPVYERPLRSGSVRSPRLRVVGSGQIMEPQLDSRLCFFFCIP